MNKNLSELPDDVLTHIFQHLDFDCVAKIRMVCRRFNQICQSVLNAGFNRMIKKHGKLYCRIKSALPRRESIRRNHPLARHLDILTSVDTRLSMLSMSYTKFMERSLCCFIPGRVLDEIRRILNLVEVTLPTMDSARALHPYDILQELRDISSMAIEHFDEYIAVNLVADNIHDSQYGDNVAPTPSAKTASSNRKATSAPTTPIDNRNELIEILAKNYSKASQKIQRLGRSQARQMRLLQDTRSNLVELEAQFAEFKKRLVNDSPTTADFSSPSTSKKRPPPEATQSQIPSKAAKLDHVTKQ